MMRLRTPSSLSLAAAAVLLPLPGLVPTATAHADTAPACASASGHAFPLTTRIHGGPSTYLAGGEYGTWYIDLVNTSGHACAAVHPVLVLVDDKRALKASQPHVEFYDGARAHPVRFETTDESELIGPFDDGFPGYTVGPGKTVTVKVRLAFAADAVANAVTANAAVVQRHGDDGDWIGQSGDYRFGIGTDTEPAPALTTRPSPTARSSAGPMTGTGTDVGASPPAARDDFPFADELARTGITVPLAALTAALLLLAGTAVLLLVRRRR